MLLEKSVLNNMSLEEVTDKNILIIEAQAFDLKEVVDRLMVSHAKFVVVTDSNLCAILSSFDLLTLEARAISLQSYLDQNGKWTEPVDIGTKMGDFLSDHENQPYRFFGVVSNGVMVGLIDKKAVLSLYTQIDEENSALITSILDNINDAVCIIDVEERVKFWNKSAEALYELSRDVIIDQKITEHFPMAILPKIVASQEKVLNVYNLPRENCHNLTSASPLYSKGILIGAISYDKDISEQFKIAENLKATESNLAVLQKELIQIGEERYSFDKMVGQDQGWLEIVKLTQMVSKSMLNILISGESGTGKEVLARAVHIESQRKGFFVPINCSAIPRDLFESELFGYESGAFSGASSKGKVGKFEFASKGTIFLDEIGDMPLEMQAKLLRVLEDGEVIPVGGNKPVQVDVRIISASNKNLLDMANQGTFRKDLYFRLNGIGVHLSPLRERPGDISLLALKFLDDFKSTYGIQSLKMPDDILGMLENYHWEGNIRELKNIIERMVILSKNHQLDVISDQFLPDVIRNMAIRMKVGPSYSLNDLLEKTEIEAIKAALKNAKSKADAAKLLKIPRSTLYFKMDKYGLEVVSES